MRKPPATLTGVRGQRRYKHDCDICQFLGTHEEYDLYYCWQGGDPTVVCRYGDDGPEYESGMFLWTDVPHYREAIRLAAQRLLPLAPSPLTRDSFVDNEDAEEASPWDVDDSAHAFERWLAQAGLR